MGLSGILSETSVSLCPAIGPRSSVPHQDLNGLAGIRTVHPAFPAQRRSSQNSCLATSTYHSLRIIEGYIKYKNSILNTFVVIQRAQRLYYKRCHSNDEVEPLETSTTGPYVLLILSPFPARKIHTSALHRLLSTVFTSTSPTHSGAHLTQKYVRGATHHPPRPHPLTPHSAPPNLPLPFHKSLPQPLHRTPPPPTHTSELNHPLPLRQQSLRRHRPQSKPLARNQPPPTPP